MMGTRDPTTPQPKKPQTPALVGRHPVQRKDPGMNAEKLNIRAPPPPPAPSPTHADNLVSPFLVTDHPSRKPAQQRPPAENFIQSPFLVDPTKYPFAEEPVMFDLEDVLMESEIYPLAPPNVLSEELEQDRPAPVGARPSQRPPSPSLPSMADMISELTGLSLSPSPPPSPPAPQSLPSLLQNPAERPISRPQYVFLL